MIQLPKRSVTRFFIPLIDVLTLLFCIFLLMPVVEGEAGPANAEGQKTNGEGGAQLAALRARVRELETRDLNARERDELLKLKNGKAAELQKRLSIHVLEIDA